MVSHLKRTKYIADYDYCSTEDDGEGSDNINSSYHSPKQDANGSHKMKSKWLSKNAIMARENRLKKKLYVTNLEKEVGKLKTDNENYAKVIESQSTLISDLKKEIKYLKSVIANSGDIGNLIKNIHHNTGMSVSTSLDQTLSLNNDYVSKQRQHVARKTAHPWEETKPANITTFETESGSNLSENGVFTDDIFDFEDILGNADGFSDLLCTKEDSNTSNDDSHLKEHNYTSIEDHDDDRPESRAVFGRTSTITLQNKNFKSQLSCAVALYFKAVKNMVGILRRVYNVSFQNHTHILDVILATL